MNVQVREREAALEKQESELKAELARVTSARAEVLARGIKAGSPISVMSADATELFEKGEMAREAAVRMREHAVAEVKAHLQTIRAQVTAAATELDQRERAQAEAKARADAEAKRAMLAKTMMTPAARAAPAAPALAEDDGPTELEAALAALSTSPKRAEPTSVGRLSPKRPSGPEARERPRVAMQASIDFGSDHNFYSGFSSNISEGGVFIATVNLAALGTQVDLSFTLPSGERIEARGVVRWIREVNDQLPDSFPGMGVQFTALSPSAQQSIASFVAQREPLFYAEAA